MKALNLTNQKFGLLTAIEPTDKRVGGKIIWKCQCDCGNEYNVAGTLLKNGKAKSCGCLSKKNIDLTNQIFGRLTVLYEQKNRPRKKDRYWHCLCECGNEVDIPTFSLTSGRTKSCGCYKKDFLSQTRTKDLTGQQFGRLTVLKRDGSDNKGQSLWVCKCSCGNITKVIGYKLSSGNTQSCGCLKSKGQEKIQSILNQENINYKKEVMIKPELKRYFFDFAIYDNQNKLLYFIEYDGDQHFDYTGKSWNTQETFIERIQNDFYKNQYCLKNNIPLYRIPYYDYTKIKQYNDLIKKEYLVKEIDHHHISLKGKKYEKYLQKYELE